jgi:hypothetical protein
LKIQNKKNRETEIKEKQILFYNSSWERKNSKFDFSLFGKIKIRKPNGKKQMPNNQERKFGLNVYIKFTVFFPFEFLNKVTSVF